MTPTLSQALPEDAPRLNQISLAAKMHWGYPRVWLNHWAKDLILTSDDWERQRIWKLENGPDIIGFCAFLAGREALEINHMWIAPPWMRQGWGRYLLEEALRRSPHPFSWIEVVSDPHAIEFYEKLGFVLVGEVESYPPGRMLPVLRRAAQPPAR
ncbi:MAG: N-acetyltransferase [Bacteroidetes bacterium]|nr:MAG: N-acetyltransferase [Bacteroidota bacterium]